ncbi:MAG: hypothetical protein KA277_12210 [Fusobacteriaceae bacterium]|nr:hypothetical protein [Fusobacteriaceae bacterium]
MVFIDFGKNIIDNYLQKSYEESKKLFITLSLMKGTTDVIEGSTINLNSIVGMDLQVGDMIQPVYDVINTIWKVSFASVVILKIETLYYEVFKVKIANVLIVTSLLTYFPSLYFKNKISTILKRISKYIFLVITFIYLVIPSSILISSGISKYFEEEYQKPAVVELNKNFDKLTKVKDELFTLEENKSIFNIPAQIDGTKQKLKNLTNEIEIVSKNIIDYTPIIVGIMLLSYIILPLIILFLLYKLVRIIFVEKLFKQ